MRWMKQKNRIIDRFVSDLQRDSECFILVRKYISHNYQCNDACSFNEINGKQVKREIYYCFSHHAALSRDVAAPLLP